MRQTSLTASVNRPAYFKSSKQVKQTDSVLKENSQFRRVTRSQRKILDIKLISLPYDNTNKVHHDIQALSLSKLETLKKKSTANYKRKQSNLVKRKAKDCKLAQSPGVSMRQSTARGCSKRSESKKSKRTGNNKIPTLQNIDLRPTFQDSRREIDDTHREKSSKNAKDDSQEQEDKTTKVKESKAVLKTSRKQQNKKKKASKNNSRKLMLNKSQVADQQDQVAEIKHTTVDDKLQSPTIHCPTNPEFLAVKKIDPASYIQRQTPFFGEGSGQQEFGVGNYKTPNIKIAAMDPKVAKKARSSKNIKQSLSNKRNSPQLSQCQPAKTLNESSKTKFSASFKHRQLLNNELPIPPHYKELIAILKYIDLQILTERQRNNHTHTLTRLSQSLIMSKQVDLTQKNFRQILYLVPQFFTHSWQKNKDCVDPTIAGSSWDLCINFPTNFSSVIVGADECDSYKRAMNGIQMQPIRKDQRIDSEMMKLRLKIMKKRVLQYTLESYQQFLSTIEKSEIPNFDPVVHRVWPHRFNLDNLPQVPLGDIKPAPVRRAKSVSEYMSEKNEQDKKLHVEATKAARKKIASESVKNRRNIADSVETKKNYQKVNSRELDESFINIKKINIEEQEPSSQFSQFNMPSTAASMNFEMSSKPNFGSKSQGVLSLMKGGKLGSTIVSDAAKKPMLLSGMLSRQKSLNRKDKNQMINLGAPSPVKRQSHILTQNVLMQIREQEQAEKIKSEWKRAETEKRNKENEYFILEKMAFQLRDLFLNQRSLSFSKVVGKIIENFNHVHNRYLSTQEVENYLRHLIKIVPKYVELLDDHYIKVNNFEINHNGVITQIKRSVQGQ